MKLKMITECIKENDTHSMSVSLEQSIKNLRVKSLIKLRKMLQAIGLAKDAPRHSVIEPIGIAISPFAGVRHAVQNKLKQDITNIKQAGLNNPALNYIENYWGFQFPTQWSDPYASQIGMMTNKGKFDDIIKSTIKKAKMLEPNERILLLQDFINNL